MRTLRRCGAVAATVATTVASLSATPLVVAAHPLHTTITEIAYTPGTRAVHATVRVFADDIARAVARRRGHAGVVNEAETLSYLSAAFAVWDGAGRMLSFQSCGSRRTGDLLWLCLQAVASSGLAGAKIRDQLLFETFPDQVNIVQVRYDNRHESVLFTRGDVVKRLP